MRATFTWASSWAATEAKTSTAVAIELPQASHAGRTAALPLVRSTPKMTAMKAMIGTQVQ